MIQKDKAEDKKSSENMSKSKFNKSNDNNNENENGNKSKKNDDQNNFELIVVGISEDEVFDSSNCNS